jgi:glycine/D-amino acid oxidase-like deaminating enzyme
MSALFTEDFRTTSYWWDHVPRPQLPDTPLPQKADVVVIGSGYTGLSAALQTARGGRDTLVLDAEAAGFGCSTRNGGQISTSVKPPFEALVRHHGEERALGILREGHNSLAWAGDFVAAEKIDCDFRRAGRFHAAHNPAQYEALARAVDSLRPELKVAHLVPRGEQHGELGTDAYFGGVIYEKHCSVDPGRFHRGMLARVQEAGASVAAYCPATAIRRDGAVFIVDTPKGPVTARNVVVATNGYTGPMTPWL